MLLKQLQTITDATWDKCWPVSTLRPLALLDLISYLFFIKKTSEEGLLNNLLPALPAGIAYPKDTDELNWSRFKNLDARSMHHIFIKENGVMELMNYYANAHLRYSDYFKAPLLITPSVILLSNAVALVKIMEVADENTQGLIIEHLVSKSAITSQQGQLYIPEDISQLMVSIMRPSLQDIIWDPSAGNASLLINSAKYIRNEHFCADQNFTGDINTGLLTGMEADLVQLRIAAMNMMLHHFHNPQLKILYKAGQPITITPRPTIIFSNLFFTGVETLMPPDEKMATAEPAREEVPLLHLILQNVQPGTHVAVLVSDIILSGSTAEIIKLREEIILRSNLEAVISIGNNPLLYGAAVLVFNKNKPATEHVWFAEITKDKGAINNKDFDSAIQNTSLNNGLQSEANSILHLWNNRDKGQVGTTGNGFYITAGAIVNNNCNLNFAANKQLLDKRDFAVKNYNPSLTAAYPFKPGNDAQVLKDKEFDVKTATAFDWGTDEVESPADNDPLYVENVSAENKLSAWRKPLLYTLLISSIIGNVIFLLYYNKSSTATDKNAPVATVDRPAPVTINSAAPNTLPNYSPTKPVTSDAITPGPTKNKVITDTQSAVTNKLQVTVPNIKQPATNNAGKTALEHSSKKIAEREPSNIPLEPNASDARNTRYAVISKAFFYTRPSENSRITGEITSYDNGDLVSSTEKNGFVYAIFYNKDGNNVSGWLSMKDLKLVQ